MTSALDLAQRALDVATGDEVEAVVYTEQSGFARFARSEVHQPTLVENELVRVRVVRDNRVGAASSNRVDDEGLRDLARRAGEAAESAPPDPDFPGLAPPEPLPDVAGFDEQTAALGAGEQARRAATAITAAGDFEAYGFFTSGISEHAIASSTGQAAEQAMTDVTALVLAAVDGASGYAERTSWRADEVDAAEVAVEAAEKGKQTRGAVALDAGRYRAVLEPYAIAELLQVFAEDTFTGLALLEERSYVCGRIGERVFDEKVSLTDDALDPRGLPKAFDAEGTPKQRAQLVADGVLEGVVWDRATAARARNGQKTTGHATSLGKPAPHALSLAGGDAPSTFELAELVGDGIYVTRLHYLSPVDPREGVITGMTRDGTFRIRDGKIAEPLVNLRFTASVPDLLAEVPGLTRETMLVNQSAFYGERYPCGARVPGLATARFTVTGTGSGPGV